MEENKTIQDMAFQGKFCLNMGIQVTICLGFQGAGFRVKKCSSEHFENDCFCQNPGFEAILAFQTPIFDKISPHLPPYVVGPCVGAPLVPFRGSWVIKYAHSNHFIEPKLPKQVKMSQNSQNHYYMCKSDIFWFQWTKF